MAAATRELRVRGAPGSARASHHSAARWLLVLRVGRPGPASRLRLAEYTSALPARRRRCLGDLCDQLLLQHVVSHDRAGQTGQERGLDRLDSRAVTAVPPTARGVTRWTSSI